jgi:hypothetical protein
MALTPPQPGERRTPLLACAIAAGRAPRGVFRPAPVDAGSSLASQLADVTRLDDPSLGGAQRLLYRELAARPEPEATQVLIELAMRQTTDRSLRQEARDLLAGRRSGEQLMLATLSAPAALSAPSALPPLGALADALLAMKAGAAAPLLALHLNHSGYLPSELSRAARALEQLATVAEFDAMLLYFNLHRTTATDEDEVEAVVAIGRALLRVGGQRGARAVEIALRDPLTVGRAKAALQPVLADSGFSRSFDADL